MKWISGLVSDNTSTCHTRAALETRHCVSSAFMVEAITSRLIISTASEVHKCCLFVRPSIFVSSSPAETIGDPDPKGLGVRKQTD
ncbi:hypothetical protein Hdeb2414_s0024g00650661 [Helianthus debilis subsp. tardiflorus]